MFIIKEVVSKFKPRLDILALGTDTRQQIAFSKKARIFSLNSDGVFKTQSEFYLNAVAFLKKNVRFVPDYIAFDPHPLFFCGEAAKTFKKKYFTRAKLRPVFHHAAHVANFGIDLGSSEKFVGVAFDGTGYGEDGNAWGGEFFVFNKKTFNRFAHFEYQLLPGSDVVIYKPWRVALSILSKIYGCKVARLDLPFFKSVPQAEAALVCEMIEKRFNAPKSSSVGRLFDATAAILNIKTVVSKEAEAAVALEKAAGQYRGSVEPYGFDVKLEHGRHVINVSSMFKQIVDGILRKKDISEIAYRFHATIAEITVVVARKLCKKCGIKKVYLSGGVFMNQLLCKMIEEKIKGKTLDFIFAKKPQTTDLGIAQGQIAAIEMEK